VFFLKTAVTILFFSASEPVPYADAITITFASRAECEARSMFYSQRVARMVAEELKRSMAPATIAGVESTCWPIGLAA